MVTTSGQDSDVVTVTAVVLDILVISMQKSSQQHPGFELDNYHITDNNIPASSYIWVILARSNPLLKSAGDIPKIMYNGISRVKPINVGFLSRFFCFFQSQASSRDYQIKSLG